VRLMEAGNDEERSVAGLALVEQFHDPGGDLVVDIFRIFIGGGAFDFVGEKLRLALGGRTRRATRGSGRWFLFIDRAATVKIIRNVPLDLVMPAVLDLADPCGEVAVVLEML